MSLLEEIKNVVLGIKLCLDAKYKHFTNYTISSVPINFLNPQDHAFYNQNFPDYLYFHAVPLTFYTYNPVVSWVCVPIFLNFFPLDYLGNVCVALIDFSEEELKSIDTTKCHACNQLLY